MKRLVLHIDRVVLQGCSGSDRLALVAGFRAGLHQELAQYCAEPGALRRLQGQSNLDRLQAGRVAIGAASAKPTSLGQHAGRGVAKGLTR